MGPEFESPADHHIENIGLIPKNGFKPFFDVFKPIFAFFFVNLGSNPWIFIVLYVFSIKGQKTKGIGKKTKGIGKKTFDEVRKRKKNIEYYKKTDALFTEASDALIEEIMEINKEEDLLFQSHYR